MPEPKLCLVCNKPCLPLLSNKRPASSEWYCPDCHKSYPMGKAEQSEIRYYQSQNKG